MGYSTVLGYSTVRGHSTVQYNGDVEEPYYEEPHFNLKLFGHCESKHVTPTIQYLEAKTTSSTLRSTYYDDDSEGAAPSMELLVEQTDYGNGLF